jgi:hypothetical protein
VGILLGAVLIISSIWLTTGIKQYHFVASWSKRKGIIHKGKAGNEQKECSTIRYRLVNYT